VIPQAARLVPGFALALALALPAAAPAGTVRVPESQAEITLSFAPVVRHAAPAVVNIYTRKVVERSVSPFAGDPFFERLFGDLFNGLPSQRRIENSLGSGVIVDPAGIVVSNYHVVGGADEITVVLSDRREFDGKVILADKEADLAVVQLEGAHDLPALELRDSDTLEVGDLVLAIGNPFGVGQTVTSGIVSGLARSGGIGERGKGYFIQTDAPINPGNSGGALIDMQGRLIGVNTAIVSRSGGSNGIGFAVPANLVARIIKAALSGATALDRPWLGIDLQLVTADLAEAMGFDRPVGILVGRMHPESPFAKSGIETGDVLVAIGGEPVNAPSELAFRAATLGTGRSAEVRFLRDRTERTAEVTLAAAPESPPRDRTTLQAPRDLRGLTVMNVNPAVIEELDLPQASAGVLVAGVDGPARRSGFRPGDIILSVDGAAVGTVEVLGRILPRMGRAVIGVERDGRRGRLDVGG